MVRSIRRGEGVKEEESMYPEIQAKSIDNVTYTNKILKVLKITAALIIGVIRVIDGVILTFTLFMPGNHAPLRCQRIR